MRRRLRAALAADAVGWGRLMCRCGEGKHPPEPPLSTGGDDEEVR